MSSSLAFKKFKSLEQAKKSERPSPDQGIGSSVSSSTTSLQQHSNKTEEAPQLTKNNMAQLRAQFFNETKAAPPVTDKSQHEAQGEEKMKHEIKTNNVLDRRKSADDGQGSVKLDALSKGNCNDIRNMFEVNIAVKKGKVPDPNLAKGPVVKMRRKVNPNLPSIFNKSEEEDNKKRNRESVPIDKKMFNHFLNKFEDDQSRQAAKAQLWKLTQKQKEVNVSWSQKQEEKRQEEEQKIMEEIARQEAEEKRQREEVEEKARKEEEARQLEEKHQEELQRAQEAAESEKKKKAKKKPKKKANNLETKELPTLVSNTCSDLRRKFQETLKANNDTKAPPVTIERPRTRKIIENPFEKQVNNEPVKRREFPRNPKENRLGDIKKRFSQLMSASSVPQAEKKTEEQKEEKDSQANAEDKKSSNAENDASSSVTDSPSVVSKRISLIQSSVDAVKGSFEKLTNSKERLSGAFSSKKSKKPSIADMQGYLISHVLYDGQVKMDMEDKSDKSNKKEHDDLFDFLLEEEETEFKEEDLLKDEYFKGLQMYLSVLDDAPKKSKKKKKKQKKVDETPKLLTQQVSNIKAQLEVHKRKQNIAPTSSINDQVVLEPTVNKVKSLFESSSKNEEISKPSTKRQSRMISNDLIQKFDCPEKVEEMKRQRDKEREERKQERMRLLELERKRIEEEMLKVKRLEEEKLEMERQERLRKEEEERQAVFKKQEEERMKKAYEKMVEEEKRKAEVRRKQDEEQKAKREKSEPAFKQRKVLGRIQHIFQKKIEEDTNKGKQAGALNIGSVKGVGEELFSRKDDNLKSPAPVDPTLAGVGGVLDSMKNKFETKAEEPVPLSHGVPMKKKDMPAAIAFAEIEQKKKNESEILSPKTQQQQEWSWKKKNPAELAAELNKAKETEEQPKTEKKSSSRSKKAMDRQRELLEDIQAMNSRLSKKNALKEHEAKMEEYSKFMDEIQDYLAEPDQSNEESTFKDDIKNFITTKLTTKKTKQKSVNPTKKSNVSQTSVSKIKEQLMSSNDATDSKTFEPALTNNGKVESLKTSIIQQYTTEKQVKVEEPIEVSNSVNAMKEMFEADMNEDTVTEKTVVKKKIVHIPDKAPVEEQSEEKSTYEWKYKKKSIQELQNFMSSNKSFVSDRVNKAVEDARDLLEESVLEESNNKTKEETQIDTYNNMMNEVEHYLNAPDRSKEEIEFKEQIEKYLDLVELPSKEKEKVDNSTLGRKPKKLNLSLYIKPSEDDSIAPEKSPPFGKAKESTSVKELQNRLFDVDNKTPDAIKDGVIVHTAGTSSLKRGFEKLNKEDKVELMSAPKITPQKFFGDILSEVNYSKSLEQLKAEGKETTWKWKQKAIGDLHTYMTGHLSHATKAIVESHKNILKADIEIQNIQASSSNRSKIEVLTKERDDEMDKFLQNVKVYLSEPTKSFVEDSVKTGIQSYLTLIEEGSTSGEQSSPLSQKFVSSGQVSSIKDNLEASQSNNDSKQARQVGRLRQQSFSEISSNNAEGESSKNRPNMSRRNADDIKESLVKKFFSDTQPKDMMKAPKTKLVQSPHETARDVQPTIEPKRKWVPPPKPAHDTSHFEAKTKAAEQQKKSEKKEFVSKYAHITDENEKRAAILAQFGVKPRPAKNVETESSESESDDDMTNYIENDLMKNNDLYVLYGDRLKERSPTKKSNKKKQQPDSVEFLRGILGSMRKSASRQDVDSSSDSLSMESSPQKSHIPGSCSNLKARFEGNRWDTDSPPRKYIEKSSSMGNVGKMFQQSVQEKSVPAIKYAPQVGKIVAPVREQPNAAPSGFLPGKHQLAKSASYHKFRQSFETGQFDESDYSDDDDELNPQTEQRTQIESELEEIRSCTRLQKMFSINKPRYTQPLEKSNSSSALPDHLKRACEEDLPTVSEARNSIKNIFEASSFKVTYGGGKSLTEQLKEKEETTEPQPNKKRVQFSDRTWVLDTINKYFDVIDEDEEEYDEENYSDEEEEESEDEQVFSTQISAQRVVYPSALPPHQICRPSQNMYEKEESNSEELEEEEEEEDLSEEDYEEENVSGGYVSLLQKSSSSSKIRGLFHSVLQKSTSGTSMDLGAFKANLNRHLQKSNQNLAAQDDESGSDECFQDCSEDPYESDRYYRIPL